MRRTLSCFLVLVISLIMVACNGDEKAAETPANEEFAGVYRTGSAINITDDFAEEFLDNKITVGQTLTYNRCFQLNADGSGLEFGDFEGCVPTQKIIVSTKRVDGTLYVDETADEELSEAVKEEILRSLEKEISWEVVDGYLCVYDSTGKSLGTFERKGNMIISVQNANYAFQKIS